MSDHQAIELLRVYFEDYMNSVGMGHALSRDGGALDYYCRETHNMWCAYKAAWNRRAAPTSEPAAVDRDAVADTGLPELREHLKMAGVLGDPITLSHQSAWALYQAMTFGPAPADQEVPAAPVADCGPNPVTWTPADVARLDRALNKAFAAPEVPAPAARPVLSKFAALEDYQAAKADFDERMKDPATRVILEETGFLAPSAPQGAQAQPEPACSCPSGDGSLRWPCLAHPPELDEVVEANRALLHERSQLGIKKYGGALGTLDYSHADMLKHALLEALDLSNYLQNAIRILDRATTGDDRTTPC